MAYVSHWCLDDYCYQCTQALCQCACHEEERNAAVGIRSGGDEDEITYETRVISKREYERMSREAEDKEFPGW